MDSEEYDWDALRSRDLREQDSGITLVAVGGSQQPVTDFSADEVFSFIFPEYGFIETEQITNVLDLIGHINRMAMMGLVNKYTSIPEKLGSLVQTAIEYPSQVRSKILSDNKNISKKNYYHGLQDCMYKSGMNARHVGIDPVELAKQMFPSNKADAMKKNEVSIQKSVKMEERQRIENTNRELLKCHSPHRTRKLKTEREISDYIKQSVYALEERQLAADIDVHSFTPSSEMGASSATTLKPSEYLIQAAAKFVYSQFRMKTAFPAGGDITPRISDEYDTPIVYSKDLNSPYQFKYNPAFHYTSLDDEGEWEWIHVQNEAKTIIGAEAKNNSWSDSERRQKYNTFLKEKAEERVVIDTDFETEQGHPYMKRVPGDVAEVVNANHILMFHKTGYSSEQDVHENKDAIHIVKRTVLATMTLNDLVPITLPDMKSIMLLPEAYWSQSHFRRTSTKPALVAPYGMSLDPAITEDAMFAITMLQMSYRQAMLDAWDKGDKFNFDQHTKTLEKAVSDPTQASALLGVEYDDTKRMKLLLKMTSMTIKPMMGFWIAPNRSKRGRATARGSSGRGQGLSMLDLDVSELETSFGIEDYRWGENVITLPPTEHHDPLDQLKEEYQAIVDKWKEENKDKDPSTHTNQGERGKDFDAMVDEFYDED